MKLSDFRDRLQTIAFSSKLYRNFLASPAPRSLLLVPADPWPGNAHTGQLLIQGPMSFVSTASLDLLHSPAEQAIWRQSAHDFEWLRDLRAVGGDAARRRARELVREWLTHYGQWHAEAWEAGATGLRIANSIGLHDFYCASADDDFRDNLFASLVQQVRHLHHVTSARLDPLSQFFAVKGMIVGSLALGTVFDGIYERALGFLAQLLPQLSDADGGNFWRNPQLQAHLTRHLIDLRALLRQSPSPPESHFLQDLDAQIGKLAGVLRFFRHGDGGFAVFNGGNEDRPTFIDAVLSQADCRNRPRQSLAATGYERLIGGRSLAIVDTGVAPRAGFDRLAHAAPGAFEFSHARERILVNCGAPDMLTALQTAAGDGADKNQASAAAHSWRQALAATAAHNGLVIADHNAVEVLPQGLGQGLQLTVSRMTEMGGERLEIAHDGWRQSCGARWRRVLWLSESGQEFCGEEMIEGKTPQPFALRFHLHPSVQVVTIKNGAAALLRLPSGAGWRFMSERFILKLQPSIYCAAGRPYRQTQQIVIEGETGKGQTRIAWAFVREDKKGAGREDKDHVVPAVNPDGTKD